MEQLKAELAKYNNKLAQINKELRQLNDQKNAVLDKIEDLNQKLLDHKSEILAERDWISPDFPWTASLKESLLKTFKFSSFRPLQLGTINSIMSGQDVILIMPTGGGKSLCYQLPAIISTGITIVISPLIALMEDQISSLRKLNVPCDLLSSTTTKSQNSAILKKMTDADSDLRLLYVTPERLAKSKRFMTSLQKCYHQKRLDRIAIDEVHCCSQWGHDFRPDYKFLNILKIKFTGVPIMGLTATATRKVIIDVKKMLNLQGCLVLKASFNRPNLFYQVIHKPSKPDECIDLIAKLLKCRYLNQSGIIYTTTIKDTEVIKEELRKRGLKVGCYHANMEPGDRTKTYERWMNRTYQAVVATIAFGLGIDKPDVRFVIHHAISKSMENFYQESGRAGRDGKRSECIVLYKLSDVFKLSPMIFGQQTGLANLYGMLEYCLNTQRCKRTMIADHFDEMWESSHCIRMCDYCARTVHVERTRNLALYISALQCILNAFEVPFTALMLIDSWLHKGAVKYRLKSVTPPDLSREEAENIIGWMLIKGLLTEDFHFTPYSTISYIQTAPDAESILEKGTHVPATQFTRFPIDEPAPIELDSEISNTIRCIDANETRRAQSSSEEPLNALTRASKRSRKNVETIGKKVKKYSENSEGTVVVEDEDVVVLSP